MIPVLVGSEEAWKAVEWASRCSVATIRTGAAAISSIFGDVQTDGRMTMSSCPGTPSTLSTTHVPGHLRFKAHSFGVPSGNSVPVSTNCTGCGVCVVSAGGIRQVQGGRVILHANGARGGIPGRRRGVRAMQVPPGEKNASL